MKLVKINLSLFHCLLFTGLFCLTVSAQGKESREQKIMYVNSDEVEVTSKYSQAVVLTSAERLIKTSGIIGTNKSGELVTGSPRAQIHQAFANVASILGAAGATMENIVEIETFLTDQAHFQDYVLERRSFFKERKQPPAISKTYYAKGLINPDAVVEIAVTALLPAKSENEKGIYVTAVITAKEGKADILQADLLKNASPSRNEKGCLLYEVFRSLENKNVFTLHEKWKSKEALDLHFQMPYMTELAKRRDELTEKIEIHIVEKLD